MNGRGTLWIIPDENVIVQDLYKCSVDNGISHTKKMKEFVQKFNLDFNFNEEDYQEAPCMLAESGHLVIKSIDDVSQLVFYIPPKVCDRQMEFLINEQFNLSKYQIIVAFSKSDNDTWDNLHGFNEIMQAMKNKNNLYHKGDNENAIKR